MAYVNHKFCWHGVITPDVEGAKAFYSESLGWGIMEQPMGDSTATMITAGGVPRAHIMPPPMEGVPPHISSYLRVKDVDASAAAAKANGGTVLGPAMDIPPGRFCPIASPSGASFLLFHEADPATAENPPAGDGAIHWVELQSTDLAADLAWLDKTFGIKNSKMPMPTGDYFILNDGETQVGGAMGAMKPGVPSLWLVWVQVPDVDATVGRIKKNGGQVYTDAIEVEGIGRMYVVADPAGAAFGVITPPAS